MSGPDRVGSGPEPAWERFSLSDRVQHTVMLLSFLVLAVTGLPQKFITSNVHLVDGLIDLMGGIETVRIAHRVAATVLMLSTIFHLIDVAYRILVRRVALSLLPRYQDVLDALHAARYNLGLAPMRPRMGRFTWEEKVEYWSLLWGTLVMIGTGFMLWNPVATARILPGEAIPAAQVVHGGEALLAVLAVLIWHFYAVHLRHFNRSMFTGALTDHEMQEEHALELERLRAGETEPPVDPLTLRRRRLIFLPVAGLVGALLLVGVYWFVTFEQTAITTLHPLK
jgi:cytochrome b subunit of formate dehydrogenase